MVRKFRAIVQSNLEPEDKQVLWVVHDALMYYNDGDWIPIISSPEVGELVEEINKRIDKNLEIEVGKLQLQLESISIESLNNILK